MIQEKSEKQKMIAGELYFSEDPELVAARQSARKKTSIINETTDDRLRNQLVQEALGSTGSGLHIDPSIRFDYGFNIHVGKNFYANFNSIFLDVCPITIGNNCMFGPNVQVYTATHPLHPEKRNSRMEYGKPITLLDNVCLGGNVVLTPGVTLGNNVVVAAGSVVTKSFPDNCLIGGNPAKLIREIELKDAPLSLTAQRKKIDSLDQQIVNLLTERMSAVQQIAEIKQASGQQVLDQSREQEVLTLVTSAVANTDYQESIQEIFTTIMTISKKFQRKKIEEN